MVYLSRKVKHLSIEETDLRWSCFPYFLLVFEFFCLTCSENHAEQFLCYSACRGNILKVSLLIFLCRSKEVTYLSATGMSFFRV